MDGTTAQAGGHSLPDPTPTSRLTLSSPFLSTLTCFSLPTHLERDVREGKHDHHNLQSETKMSGMKCKQQQQQQQNGATTTKGLSCLFRARRVVSPGVHFFFFPKWQQRQGWTKQAINLCGYRLRLQFGGRDTAQHNHACMHVRVCWFAIVWRHFLDIWIIYNVSKD